VETALFDSYRVRNRVARGGNHARHVETAAYFVIAEALANIARHADARRTQRFQYGDRTGRRSSSSATTAKAGQTPTEAASWGWPIASDHSTECSPSTTNHSLRRAFLSLLLEAGASPPM
jgi:hypothetical protein